MTFLDFQSKSKEELLKSTVTTPSKPTPSQHILNRVPPKIESIKCSDVLSRAAAFLPQLAASNRAILQRNPDDVNIEVLNGDEAEVIEMKLGLGVFEEKVNSTTSRSTSRSRNRAMYSGSRSRSSSSSRRSSSSSSSSSRSSSSSSSSSSDSTSSSDSSSDEDPSDNTRKIMVLPSELRAAAQANPFDPYENIINSLLFFDGTDDEDEEDCDRDCDDIEKDDEGDAMDYSSSTDEDGAMQVLDFE